MFTKLDRMKKAYVNKKLSMIKGMENNEKTVKKMEKQEENLMEKLKTTFSKFQEFTSQSSTFDNVTQNIISNINISRKHLKPLSKFDEFKTTDSVYTNHEAPGTFKLVNNNLESQQQTGNKS
jgi:hypothetical protein